MSQEAVAFVVVLVAVGVIPGCAALVAHRAYARRVEARLNEILAILRGRQARRAVGYELPPRSRGGDGAS